MLPGIIRLRRSIVGILAALLLVVLGLVPSAHAIGPTFVPEPSPIYAGSGDDEAPPAVVVLLASYRAHGPPVAIVLIGSRDDASRIFFVVVRNARHSAGANVYAYCGGDPVNRSDPSGLDWVWNDPPGSWKWDGQFAGQPMTEDEAKSEGLFAPEKGPSDTDYWGPFGLPPDSDGNFRVGADISEVLASAEDHLSEYIHQVHLSGGGYGGSQRAFAALVEGKSNTFTAYYSRLRNIAVPPPVMFDPNYSPPNPPRPGSEEALEGAGMGQSQEWITSVVGTLFTLGTTPAGAVRGVYAGTSAVARGTFRGGQGLYNGGRAAFGRGLAFGGRFAEEWSARSSGAFFTPSGFAVLQGAYERAVAAAYAAGKSVFTRGGRVFTLEEGTATSGWKHIFDRHVDPARFAGKTKFPSTYSKADIMEILKATIKHGAESQYEGRAVFLLRANFRGSGYKNYRATVNPDGSVQTFHPLD